MALARVNLVLQEDDGDLVDGASVEVRNEATLALAPVFSDRAGASSLGNPYTAADGSDAGFYVAPGAYKITATAGAFSKIIRYQPASIIAEQDYETGTWTPTLFFGVTNGNLSIVYFTRDGTYVRVGRLVLVRCDIITSTFTHTTASGQAIISGLPDFGSILGDYTAPLSFQGITKASYTQFHVATAAGPGASASLEACGSGQSLVTVNAADMPSGGTLVLRFTLAYEAE
jgi:hypothetical protein